MHNCRALNASRRGFATKAIANLQERLVALCRHRGFVFPGSELYGGLANSFDYGPLGVLMKKNIIDRWWFEFVQKRPNCVGLDSAVLLNSAVWKASGHVDNFTDPMTVCSNCNTRVRVDQLLESKLRSQDKNFIASLSLSRMDELLLEHEVACPKCHKTHSFQPVKQFNLLFRTNMGATDETCDWIYLRPETAQGAYINFSNVQSTMRKKLPFGIGQVGKSFRNEISPGHFLFRTREFEQLELQFFTHPNESDQWYGYWVNECYNFLTKYGIRSENLRKHEHMKEELAHYARATTDIQFKYPFGWSELWGIANRTSYDLKKHMEASGKSLKYQDIVAKEDFFPHVIEPALGAGRVMLSMLLDAYYEDEVNGKKRTVLRLHPEIAPYRFAVLPLVKKEPLLTVANQLFEDLCACASVDYDVSGSIGRRYRRQDEIGTPMCLTVDFDTLEDKCVTIRDRDSMQQNRVAIEHIIQGASARRSSFF
ncbi:glycyl-trna synthetase [Plasmopara halstedii]|uniref:glycine--tRNA ligase n=1 Tax=Plasmopara halstedii TaxID=4781 RepID=A0A0P1B0B3_PLAHL|nr:glycyl-trna synthetase [Plasmopara halstedii]CEG48090.1 glycyl-trna synthetase [Plasmopara halstedii]|eukprot:XP_024584459.1 glycyl-trna synthetase [Plasmopara halstedii]